MCRIDDGDMPTVHRQRQRRARVAHACCECRRPIEPGETYRYTFMVFDGDPSSFALCDRCQVAADWLARNCGGYCFGEVADEMRERAHEAPDYALPFLRVVAGMRRQWRSSERSGLLPVPTPPGDWPQ